MPELPEVETVRRSLEPVIIGRRIVSIEFRRCDLRWTIDRSAFEQRVVGHKVSALRRRGKFLLFELANATVFLVHLGMSGRLGLFQTQDSFEPHTHVVFFLDQDLELRYRDPRRFGFLQIVNSGESAVSLDCLGVEPLSDDFTAEVLGEIAGSSKRSIKNVLLDGRAIAGLGNIYTCESLFYAGIDPFRTAVELDRSEIDRLTRAIKDVLRAAVQKGGTTLLDFRNALGEPGFFQFDLAVYGRSGSACRCCGRAVERVVQNGRSTYYCPVCQK